MVERNTVSFLFFLWKDANHIQFRVVWLLHGRKKYSELPLLPLEGCEPGEYWIWG
jgi:hypothetical protein